MTIQTTEILITSLHTGGTEAETQAAIDLLQRWGWNVMWGIGPSRFCDVAEEARSKPTSLQR